MSDITIKPDDIGTPDVSIKVNVAGGMDGVGIEDITITGGAETDNDGPGGGTGGIAHETDPTVPAWAKQPEKPTYTAEEVGARPADWKPTPQEIGAQPAGNYALKSEIPSVPVQSVNGKTGAVQLSASDVGALPADTNIPEPYTLPTASTDVKGGVKVGEGLQMDGDVLGVVPESKYELLSSVTVGEGGAKKITFPDMPNVKAVMACILAPTTEKAIGTYMEITADNGETFAVGGDYGDKDGTHSIRIEVYIDNGILAGMAQGRTANWGGGAMKGINNAGKARFADYIKSAYIYCSNSDRNILEGTTIGLYGVRA